MEPHLDPDTLAAYVDGRLAVAELDRADRHIDSCRACRQELSSLAALASQPGSEDAPLLPEGKLGRYHVLRELGRGSMGIVLRAYDPELARPVAIKLLRDVDPSTRDLLRQEARALAKLRHPNVVTVYDVIVEGDRLYVAMELVEGDTLRGFCRGRPQRAILDACIQAGQGLAAAHDAGVIHRDFKPENVLCTGAGEARVSDFGLAHTRDDGEVDGALVGTPAYMAPEVLRREPATPASDQYSYCVAVYEMLTGARPDSPDAGGALPPWLAKVLARGLSREPAARYPSLAALVAALADDPIARRRRRLLLAAGALAAVATGALAVTLASSRDPAPRCAIDDGVLAGAWDADLRAQVTAALGSANASDAAPRIVAALDDYATTWLATRRDACAATHERGEQSQLVLAHRVACLDRGRRQLGELVRVLATADPRSATAAQEAIARLVHPSECTATAVGEGLPADPAGRALVEHGRTLLDRAAALHHLGKLDEADRLVTALLGQLASTDLPRLRAEALYQRGRLEADRSRHERAESLLFDALHEAERGRDDALIAAIWVELVMTTGAHSHRFELALSNARAADAALARIEPGSNLQIRYNYTLGALLLQHGKLDAARPRLETARALASSAAGATGAADDSRRRAHTALIEVALCDVERQAGKLAAAREHCTAGISLLESTLGPEHLRVAIALSVVGSLAFNEPDLDAAGRAYQRSIEIFERRGQRDHLVYALALSNLGAVFSSRDDMVRARELFERALAMFEAHHPQHPQRRFALQGLASLALRSGDAARAVGYYEQVRAIGAASSAPESPSRLVDDYNLALAYRDAKQTAKAQTMADDIAARALTPAKESWIVAARALELAADLASDRRDYRTALGLRERALAAISNTKNVSERALVQLHLGETHIKMGRYDLALAPLEQAEAYHAEQPEEHYERGATRLRLAVVVLRTKRDRMRALALAKQAIDDLAKASSGEQLAPHREAAAKLVRELGGH